MRFGLIFDLDGTLWDATEPIAKAWEEVGKDVFGQDYSLSVEKVRTLMGKTMDQIAVALTPSGANPEDTTLFAQRCFDYERDYLAQHPGTLFPGELEVLEQLAHSIDLFIVSNCQLGYIENFLAILPNHYFKGHLCWGDTQSEKAKTIRILMDRYGIDRALYIGDTEGDELAAHGAGLAFVHAAYGFGKAINPEYVLESLDELPALVSSWRA